MRRIKRAPIAVFNLSFLDIISCAFGAVVMLVLLSKNADNNAPPNGDTSAISILLDTLLAGQQSIQELQGALSVNQDKLYSAQERTSALQEDLSALQQSTPKAQETLNQLNEEAQSLRDTIAQANALLNVPNSTEKPDKDVGGVPTDADYVVFIIDNSGSMVQIGWRKIVNVVEDVIKNHPKLKGFNVMSADGRFIPGKPSGWIIDTPSNRRIAMAELRGFKGGGSEPEVGIYKAIETYKNTNGKVSLYVFGDEYAAHDLQYSVEQITKANQDPATKQPRFRIHGIGFYWQSGSNTRVGFAAFMKAIANHNRGAFIALQTK